MSAADWPAVEKIYGDGIATGDATFEIEPPSWEEFDRGRLVVDRGRQEPALQPAIPVSPRKQSAGVRSESSVASAPRRRSARGGSARQDLP